MFKVDDIVIYGINGICKIVGIEEKVLMETKKNYLVLKPLNGDKSTYFVPVDNENLLNKMRKVLSEDEINRLIDSMPNEKAVWIDNERERKDCYKKIISDGNHSELIKMIKSIYFEKIKREEKGKNFMRQMNDFLKMLKKFCMMNFNMC